MSTEVDTGNGVSWKMFLKEGEWIEIRTKNDWISNKLRNRNKKN